MHLPSLKGKTIGIIGSPGSGKTFLATKFQALNDCIVFFEEVFEFPEHILYNLKQRKNLFETIVWFRNYQLDHALRAESFRKENKIVVLDSTIYQYQLYIDFYIKNIFSRKILRKQAALDNFLIRPPDITIFIKTTPKLTKQYLLNKGKDWPLYSKDHIKFLSHMPLFTDKFMQEHSNLFPKLITIERSDYDFDHQENFDKLLKLLESIL